MYVRYMRPWTWPFFISWNRVALWQIRISAKSDIHVGTLCLLAKQDPLCRSWSDLGQGKARICCIILRTSFSGVTLDGSWDKNPPPGVLGLVLLKLYVERARSIDPQGAFIYSYHQIQSLTTKDRESHSQHQGFLGIERKLLRGGFFARWIFNFHDAYPGWKQ